MNDKIYISNGYIIAVEVNHPLYAQFVDAYLNKPTAPEGFDYRLKADLTWELYELPPVPDDDELTAEEALDIITGGAE